MPYFLVGAGTGGSGALLLSKCSGQESIQGMERGGLA